VDQLPEDACGISLRIPVPVQVETLADTFPSLRKIGLLFDPNHNQWFFDLAVSAVRIRQTPLEIIPLPVTARNRIAGVLNENLRNIDAVWMIPDPTVISEKLIQYVIKQALYADAGVIGYNAYFTRAGAFFSFEFDYQALGRQAGEAILDVLSGKTCTHMPPLFDTRINLKMVEKLGLKVEETP
jgi:putative ABC transport system substrate-binding protein